MKSDYTSKCRIIDKKFSKGFGNANLPIHAVGPLQDDDFLCNLWHSVHTVL